MTYVKETPIRLDWQQEMIDLGYNYRLTDIQTALGISQLKKLDRFLLRRRQIALRYIKEFSSIDEIILPPNHKNIDHAWHIFPIQFRSLDRNEVYNKLIKLELNAKSTTCQFTSSRITKNVSDTNLKISRIPKFITVVVSPFPSTHL